MELVTSPFALLADLVLFAVITYVAFHAVKRINRYEEPLGRFMKITAASLSLASFGRLLDIADNFMSLRPGIILLEKAIYFVSIIGLAYGLFMYVRGIEKTILRVPDDVSATDGVEPGGYLYLGRDGEVVDFMASVGVPALVVTRSPWKYSDLGDHVQTLWVTQVGQEGVSRSS
ncbi:hypothetical protein E3E36_04875 [Thermococcus sp. M36]|uniref:hypothetical protein n=1 Tax=Thermococcus sp. M36 TaxID=1638261 RepID=UPI00143B1F28|nr:hypothetical protein [Thermococcus sp. M36]NJE05485.1 hypothetical protein [Thermococcus sp. M36]